MRRATRRSGVLDGRPALISIHALHEESDRSAPSGHVPARTISIHALHEESDSGDFVAPILKVISIHALHEESDEGE